MEQPQAPLETDPLIRAAVEGDRRAARALVSSHQRSVFGLVWRMLGRRATTARAEELTQETFVRVFRALGRFKLDGPASFRTWLLTIATRTAIDDLRRRRLEVVETGPDLANPDDRHQPDRLVERARLGEAIATAVDSLGPAPRAAFILRAYHGLTYPEIAAALELDVGTVKSRIHRARQALQASLKEHRNG